MKPFFMLHEQKQKTSTSSSSRCPAGCHLSSCPMRGLGRPPCRRVPGATTRRPTDMQAQSITNFLGKGYDGKPMMKNINEHDASFNHIETFPSHFFNDDDDGGVEYVAPKYMLDLYRKFEEDRYSTPMANIVRSFVNIHTGETNANRINA